MTIGLVDRGPGLHLVGDALDGMRIQIANEMSKAREVDLVVVVHLEGEDGGTWTIDLKDNIGIHRTEARDRDWTVSAHVHDWLGYARNATASRWIPERIRITPTGRPRRWKTFTNFFRD